MLLVSTTILTIAKMVKRSCVVTIFAMVKIVVDTSNISQLTLCNNMILDYVITSYSICSASHVATLRRWNIY
jgi:hypothetical protein